MRKLNQSGSLLVPLVVVIALFVCSLGFGIWAFVGRQDFKNKKDTFVAEAVKKAVSLEDAKKEAEFAEASKSPVKIFVGLETYGSLSFNYPRPWSAYVSEKPTGTVVLSGTFHPNQIPDFSSGIPMALQFRIVNSSITSVLKTYDSSVKKGTASIASYIPAKVTSVKGNYISGEIFSKIQGSLVILPVRDKTIEIWTEGSDYVGDFNNTVLPSLTFVP